MKSLAGLAVVGGAGAALALPVDSAPAALALPASDAANSAVAGRLDAGAAARSSRRAVIAVPAVSAPVHAAPAALEPVGVTGVTAVAKPTPKAKPKPKPVQRRSDAPAPAPKASTARSYSTSVSAKCSGLGLTPNAARVCSAVQSAFGLSTIGGYRPNAGEHSTGQAVDFMISSRSQGDAIAAFVQSHVGEFNVKYIIWRQRYWEPGSSWDPMEDRGSVTANHYDHVHVTVN